MKYLRLLIISLLIFPAVLWACHDDVKLTPEELKNLEKSSGHEAISFEMVLLSADRNSLLYTIGKRTDLTATWNEPVGQVTRIIAENSVLLSLEVMDKGESTEGLKLCHEPFKNNKLKEYARYRVKIAIAKESLKEIEQAKNRNSCFSLIYRAC